MSKKKMKAIPTEYNDILFKSKLEASYAKTLDKYDIKWSYEVNGYDIDGTWYLPDFWLPEIKTFLEVKGPLVPGAEKVQKLARSIALTEEQWWEPEILVLLGNESGELKRVDDDDTVELTKCNICNRYWFVPISSSYTCRNCHNYDGNIVHEKLVLTQL